MELVLERRQPCRKIGGPGISRPLILGNGQIPAGWNLPGHEEVEFEGIKRRKEDVRLAEELADSVHEDLPAECRE
jgi:hypothetical protein